MAKIAKPRADVIDEDEKMEWWRRFSPTIAGEFVAEDGLRKRRQEMEKLVEPHLSKRKTLDVILFRGSRCFVKQLESNREGNHIWNAILALQCIYNLEAAWEVGDIDTAIRMAVGFAWLERDLDAHDRWGFSAVVAVAEHDHTRRTNVRRGKRKQGKTKLLNEDVLVQMAYVNNRKRKDWLQATTAELRNRHGRKVSSKTVSRRLRKLGITNKS